MRRQTTGATRSATDYGSTISGRSCHHQPHPQRLHDPRRRRRRQHRSRLTRHDWNRTRHHHWPMSRRRTENATVCHRSCGRTAVTSSHPTASDTSHQRNGLAATRHGGNPLCLPERTATAQCVIRCCAPRTDATGASTALPTTIVIPNRRHDATCIGRHRRPATDHHGMLCTMPQTARRALADIVSAIHFWMVLLIPGSNGSRRHCKTRQPTRLRPSTQTCATRGTIHAEVSAGRASSSRSGTRPPGRSTSRPGRTAARHPHRLVAEQPMGRRRVVRTLRRRAGDRRATTATCQPLRRD